MLAACKKNNSNVEPSPQGTPALLASTKQTIAGGQAYNLTKEFIYDAQNRLKELKRISIGDTVVSLYRKRWQIESLFKRIKQNYPLKYFLGDSENAIKIQIWCSLIADILLKIVKKAAAAKWSFSNLAAMIRLHLMTYIDMFRFLKSPEKSLLRLFYRNKEIENSQLAFIT